MFEITKTVTMPLDQDGFLRRECPHCIREFKWLPSKDEDQKELGEVHSPPADYFCPYCGTPASPDQWLTQPQAGLINEHAQEVAADEIGKILDKTFGGIGRGRSSRRGAGFSLSVSVNKLHATKPHALPPEPNDMIRVTSSCHPDEPVKVVEGWDFPVHCLVCGTAPAQTGPGGPP